MNAIISSSENINSKSAKVNENQSTPKISVIVPVYKVEQYLPQCIESILKQTFSDFELLLIDDGSPDNSGQICDEYAAKDSRIRVFHKENGGVSSARNLGLDNAKGEWIAFVDSDDELVSNALNYLFLKTDTDVDIIIGQWSRVDGYSRKIPLLYSGLLTSREYIDLLLIGKIYSGVVGKLFRKYLFNDVPIIPSYITINEDLLLNLLLTLRARNVFVLSNIVYKYYNRPLSASSVSMSLDYWITLFDFLDQIYLRNSTLITKKSIDIYKLRHLYIYFRDKKYSSQVKSHLLQMDFVLDSFFVFKSEYYFMFDYLLNRKILSLLMIKISHSCIYIDKFLRVLSL